MKNVFFHAVALMLFGVACHKADPPRTSEPGVAASMPVPEVPTAVVTPVTSPAPIVQPTAPLASMTAPAAGGRVSFPPVTDGCSTVADCEMVFTTNGCCHQCPPRFGNKAWAANVRSFCAGADASHCGPLACSWATSGPACKSGHCVDAAR